MEPNRLCYMNMPFGLYKRLAKEGLTEESGHHVSSCAPPAGFSAAFCNGHAKTAGPGSRAVTASLILAPASRLSMWTGQSRLTGQRLGCPTCLGSNRVPPSAIRKWLEGSD